MSSDNYRERIYTEDIEEMIEKIVKTKKRPYPLDITDQVFLTIEADPELLRLYHLYAGENTHAANCMIGKFVKQFTHLQVKGTCTTPKSTLIKTYTRLG